VFRSDYDLILTYLGIMVCHNHFFFFLGSTGLVGVFLYYGVILGSFYQLFRAAGDNRLEPPKRHLAAQLLGFGVVGFVFTLSSTTFTTLTYNVGLALIIYAATLPWRTNEHARAPLPYSIRVRPFTRASR
jgi:O-antigen ligase